MKCLFLFITLGTAGGNKVKVKRRVYFVGLLCGTALLIAQGWAQPKPEVRGATIVNAFAADEGYFGYIWKIYIEAEDPDGQMLKIACCVDQPGLGRYQTDWVYLKPEYRGHFKGYLQWNTFSSRTPDMTDGTQIMLKVSIIDKAGNESQGVVFPFTFRSGAKGQPVLPAPFNQGDNPRLGYISIDLFDPNRSTHNSGGQ